MTVSFFRVSCLQAGARFLYPSVFLFTIRRQFQLHMDPPVDGDPILMSNHSHPPSSHAGATNSGDLPGQPFHNHPQPKFSNGPYVCVPRTHFALADAIFDPLRHMRSRITVVCAEVCVIMVAVSTRRSRTCLVQSLKLALYVQNLSLFSSCIFDVARAFITSVDLHIYITYILLLCSFTPKHKSAWFCFVEFPSSSRGVSCVAWHFSLGLAFTYFRDHTVAYLCF